MKKLISGLLSLLLLSLVLAVPAYAENNVANDKTPPRSTTMNRAGVNDVTDMVPGMNNVRNDMDRMNIFGNDQTDNVDNNRVRAAATDDNGMDWGWLGLLGLIGLAGLGGRNRQRT